MTNDKLEQIIARKNEQLEYDTVRRATEIIDEIAEYQQAKVEAEKKIVELREELRKLEIPQVNKVEILGG